MTPSLPFRPFLSELEAYKPGEQVDGGKIIKLNTNENPYPPSPGVLEEIEAGLHRLRLYPNPTSLALRRALAGYHGLDIEQVLVGNGSDEILRLLIQAFVGKGSKVAIVDPTYSLYPVLALQTEGEAEVYPLVNRESLSEPFFAGKEPLLILPNPNPPVGTLYSRAEIAKLCRARAGSLVVIDEAYVDFAPRDMVPLLWEFPNLAITRTFSKSFSLAGMRIGYLLGSAELIDGISKLKDSYNVNHLSQVAAAAAVAHVAEMQKHSDAIIETRNKTTESLRRMGYIVPESHGNFLFAIHPEAGRHYQELRKRHILVRYWDTPFAA